MQQKVLPGKGHRADPRRLLDGARFAALHLRRRNRVQKGHASGFLPPLDAMELNKKSLIFTKASMKDYNRTLDDNARMSAEVFEMIAAGVLKPNISREYALDEIAQAHIDIAGRQTTGAIILTF